MKRALSVAAVTALSLLVFLSVGYAQEEGAEAVSVLLEQELAAMEAAFGGLQTFMSELITEVKGNMADIDTFDLKVDDLRDIVSAVSVEIKNAEGKIVGLRADVTALQGKQQELLVRVVALEAGLSELAAFCDELKARLDVTGADLGILREEFDSWVADYGAFMVEYEAFREALLADIAALEAGVYGEIAELRDGVYADLDTLRSSVYADFLLLEENFSAGLAELGDDFNTKLTLMAESFSADISMLSAQYGDLALRVTALEDEDVGTFKKKVLELERSMAALAIKVDNNRTKLEGFDHAIARISEEMEATREGIIQSNQALLGEYDARLQALEDGTDLQAQIDTLYFISIVALLAGVGALIWGFLGT